MLFSPLLNTVLIMLMMNQLIVLIVLRSKFLCFVWATVQNSEKSIKSSYLEAGNRMFVIFLESFLHYMILICTV